MNARDGGCRKVFAARLTAGLNSVIVYGLLGVLLAWIMTTALPVDQYLLRGGLSTGVADVFAGVLPWVLAFSVYLGDAAIHLASYGMRRTGLLFFTSASRLPTRLRVVTRCAAGVLLLPLVPVSAGMLLLGSGGRTLADRLCGIEVVDSKRVDEKELVS